jgi:hypothetical protein
VILVKIGQGIGFGHLGLRQVSEHP